MTELNTKSEKLTGFYRGKVIKHLSNGFCKIWIPEIYPDKYNNYENADNLPSAEQASSLAFGCNNGNGIFSYPNLSSTVWCFFANGDQNYPVYFASSLGGISACTQEISSDVSSSNNSSNRTEKNIGNWDNVRPLAGQKNDAYIHKLQLKNIEIVFNETGNLSCRVHDDSNEKYSELTMNSAGDIKIDSTNSITLNTQQLKINADTQLNITSPYFNSENIIQAVIHSPSITLSSENGHTDIISTGGHGKTSKHHF